MFFYVATLVNMECKAVDNLDDADIIVIDNTSQINLVYREGAIIAVLSDEDCRKYPVNVVFVKKRGHISRLVKTVSKALEEAPSLSVVA